MKKLFCLAFTAWATFNTAFGQTLTEFPNNTTMQVTTRLPGHVNPSTITVSIQNGMAIYQDDIVLGPVEKILNPPVLDRGLVMEDLDDRWPNGRIPFEIDGAFTTAYRDTILTAIDYINGSTNLQIVPRVSGDVYWIHFKPSDVCSSLIGLQDFFGQNINLKDNVANGGDGCGFIQIIHEIAHAAGLWHEQCRADRDIFVDIHWDNIKAENHHDFEKDIDNNIEIGDYDFDSRMHYFSHAFAINKNLPTITRKNGPQNMKEIMGNSSDYSGGDVWAINWLYPVRSCPVLYALTRPIPVVAQRLLYEATNTILSNTTIRSTNEITYDAGFDITLQPGFEVLAGAKFRAVIDGCGGQVVPLISGEADQWYAQSGSFEARTAKNLENRESSENASVVKMNISIAPNPFSGSTSITYALDTEQPVTMNLLDATGKLVATPMPSQTQSEGEHQFNLEAGNLPTGMYFLVLQMGDKRETRRLILSK